MRLSLFSRLTIGYLVIFLVVAMASASAVLELRYFRDLTESILNIDNRMLDHEKMLADSILAQSRAEQKFIITRDETWYQQFVRLKSEFDSGLQSALALNDPAAASILKAIQRDSERYQQLVQDEAHLLRANKRYPQAQYKSDKDLLVDALLSACEKLRQNQQRVTHAKVADLAALPIKRVKQRSSLQRAAFWQSSRCRCSSRKASRGRSSC